MLYFATSSLTHPEFSPRAASGSWARSAPGRTRQPNYLNPLLLILALAMMNTAVPSGLWAQTGQSEQYYETTAMPSPRDKAGTAVAGDYLYVVGGNTPKGFTTDALAAPIHPDGTVGDWVSIAPLPEPRIYLGNCTFGVGNVVYIAGGNIHDATRNLASPDVLYGKASSDGSITEWKRSPKFPGSPVQCNVALHHNSIIYVLGGANDSNEPQAVVYRAPIQAGGDIGQWVTDTPLPIPLWFHCGAVANGRIYIWGGASTASGHPRLAQCYSSKIQPDGSLGTWAQEQPLPIALSLAQAASCGPFILNFAGVQENRTPSSNIFFGYTTQAGLVNGWSRVLTDLPISCYAAATYDPKRSVVFLPGGQTSVPGQGQQQVLQAAVFGFRVLGSGSAEQQTTAASAPRPAPPKAPSAATGPAPQVQWLTVTQGIQAAKSSGKPLLIVLGSKSLGRSAQFWTDVVQNPGFAAVAQRHVCAVVNVEQDPSTAMALGIFRVPAVVVLSPDATHFLARPLMSNITLQQVLALP